MITRATWLRQSAAGIASLGLGASARAADAEALDLIRVATTPNDAGACVYYAEDLGLFKRAGLRVEITAQNNGGIIGSSVASGAIDIAQASTPSIASAHDHGIPFTIITAGSEYISSEPTNQLLVTKSSPIHTAADLTGKVVAVAGLLNSAHIATASWIDKHGGNSAGVKFIEMSYAEMLPAVLAGRIDAASISEPFLSAALPQVRSIGNPYDAIASDFILGVWFARIDYIKEHPSIVRRFNDVMIATAKWANAHKAETAVLLQRDLKTTVAPGMLRVRYSESTSAALLQPFIDAAAKYKAIKATFPAGDVIATLPSA